jgi:hypothetical protein
MRSTIVFDTSAYHIYIPVFLMLPDGRCHELDAVLDTGAPFTEFSDKFLQYVGLINATQRDVALKPGLASQRYGKISIPLLDICGHRLDNMQVYVSRFDVHWGVDALIGLDFFGKFKVTVDYRVGHLITEPHAMV